MKQLDWYRWPPYEALTLQQKDEFAEFDRVFEGFRHKIKEMRAKETAIACQGPPVYQSLVPLQPQPPGGGLVIFDYISPFPPRRPSILVNVDEIIGSAIDLWSSAPGPGSTMNISPTGHVSAGESEAVLKKLRADWSAEARSKGPIVRKGRAMGPSEGLYGSNPCAEIALEIDRSRFPHSCPRCGGAAYVGLTQVDCSAGCAP